MTARTMRPPEAGSQKFLVCDRSQVGAAGKHIRTSAGVASLPMGFAASVYMIVEAA
jgi:hypothetical protein